MTNDPDAGGAPQPSYRRQVAWAWIAAAVLAAGCSTQKAPAGKIIADIESAVNTAAADAARFVPDQLADVQSKLGDLRGSYDKKDYRAVLQNGPPLLSTAQGLETAATAKRDLIAQGFKDQWTALSSTVPVNARSVQSRIDFLSKRENRKLASGVDLSEASSVLGDAATLWSKAQDAHSQGSLEQAVIVGKSAKAKIAAVAASMKLDLAEPAAVTDTSP